MILPAEGDFRLEDEAATLRLGAGVAGALEIHEAVCLWGPLGAGKSTLARGLIRALTHAHEEAPSPTFTLAQFYAGSAFQLAHFDLYRIARPDEVREIGLDEALDDGAVVIEWPERLQGHLPADRLDIELLILGEEGRNDMRLARLTPHGLWEGRPIEF